MLVTGRIASAGNGAGPFERIGSLDGGTRFRSPCRDPSPLLAGRRGVGAVGSELLQFELGQITAG